MVRNELISMGSGLPYEIANHGFIIRHKANLKRITGEKACRTNLPKRGGHPALKTSFQDSRFNVDSKH